MLKKLAFNMTLAPLENMLLLLNQKILLKEQPFQLNISGVMLMELIIYHGQEINTFLNSVDHVGLMELHHHLLTE